jgi:hypothetical protein
MDQEQVKLVESVLKKLSTLRSTLQEDEQEILDQLILNTGRDETAEQGITSLPDEVKSGLTSRPSASQEVRSGADEAVERGMTSDPDEADTAKSLYPKISLDPQDKTYKRVE